MLCRLLEATDYNGEHLAMGDTISCSMDKVFSEKALYSKLMAIKVENLADIVFLTKIEDMMQKHDKVLCLDLRNQSLHKSSLGERSYLFKEDSYFEYVSPIRFLAADFIAPMAEELPIKVYYLVDERKDDQIRFLVGHKEDDKFIVDHETWSAMSGFEFFQYKC